MTSEPLAAPTSEHEKIGRTVALFLQQRFGDDGIARLAVADQAPVHRFAQAAILNAEAMRAWDASPEAAQRIVGAMHEYCSALAALEAIAKDRAPPLPTIRGPSALGVTTH